MTNGIDQLHMKMTCKKYRLKLYITKPYELIDHFIRINNNTIPLKVEDGQIEYDIDCECEPYKCQDYISECTECNKIVCIECNDRKKVVCNICHEHNVNCPSITLSKCDGGCTTFCNECGPDQLKVCIRCGIIGCDECIGEYYYNQCYRCGKARCYSCNPLENECNDCNKEICNDCVDDDDFRTCNDCTEYLCYVCYKICNKCNKSYCRHCMKNHNH